MRYTTSNKTLPTRNNFTGQYSYVADEATDLGNSGFGLMFYQSRFYDPALGRFAQADTIVPGGSQGLDRYAYVNNSPLNYVDPSGHDIVDRSILNKIQRVLVLYLTFCIGYSKIQINLLKENVIRGLITYIM